MYRYFEAQLALIRNAAEHKALSCIHSTIYRDELHFQVTAVHAEINLTMHRTQNSVVSQTVPKKTSSCCVISLAFATVSHRQYWLISKTTSWEL